MANKLTSVIVKPLLTADHEEPLLVDKNTQPPQVPAKIFVPLMANELTEVFGKPIEVHEAPLLVDKNTPLSVPAKMFVPLMANE